MAAKLYFRYGTVGSAKTLNLLAVAHNYQQQGKKVCLIKPKIDTRFGENCIRSRAGLQADAHLIIDNNAVINLEDLTGVSCILVDEVQFMSKGIIDQFRNITKELLIPVICYGLRTDFRSQLFEGSKRLMELADAIEEVKSTCYFCNKKSVFNLKHVNGKATVEGPAIQLGAEELYFPVCYKCYMNQIKDSVSEKKLSEVSK